MSEQTKNVTGADGAGGGDEPLRRILVLFSGIMIDYTERKQMISEMQDITQSENREDMPEERQSGGMEFS